MPPLNTNHIVMIMRTIIVMMMIMTTIIIMIMPFAKFAASSKSGAARSQNASKIDHKAELRGTVAAV